MPAAFPGPGPCLGALQNLWRVTSVPVTQHCCPVATSAARTRAPVLRNAINLSSHSLTSKGHIWQIFVASLDCFLCKLLMPVPLAVHNSKHFMEHFLSFLLIIGNAALQLYQVFGEWLTLCRFRSWVLPGDVCCQCSASLKTRADQLQIQYVLVEGAQVWSLRNLKRSQQQQQLQWISLVSSVGQTGPSGAQVFLWDVPFITGLHRCCSRRAELKQLVLWVGLSVQCQWVLVPQGEPKLCVLTWNYLLRISTTPCSEPEYLFSSIQQFQ